jgi:hypothetical protein
MAIVKTGKISQSWLMSNKNAKSRRPVVATVEHYVAAADVTAYNAAADDAARLATDLGIFFAAEDALSRGVMLKREVGFAYVENAAVPPAVSAGVYSFDKFGISYQADGEYYVSSIPGRDMADVVIGPDGITVITGAGASAETTAYVAAFNTTILSEEGVQGTVVLMDVKS